MNSIKLFRDSWIIFTVKNLTLGFISLSASVALLVVGITFIFLLICLVLILLPFAALGIVLYLIFVNLREIQLRVTEKQELLRMSARLDAQFDTFASTFQKRAEPQVKQE